MSNLEKMIEAAQQIDATRAAEQAVKSDPMMAVAVCVVAITMLVVAFTLKRAWSR